MRGVMTVETQKPVKGIFFDIGWTMAYPATGDFWTLPKGFFLGRSEIFKSIPKHRIDSALEKGMKYLDDNHYILTVADELSQMTQYYEIIFGCWPELDIGINDICDFAREKVLGSDSLLLYDDVVETLTKLKGRYKLGIISDTWPSTQSYIDAWGIRGYFDAITFSCYLGVYKPHEKMYRDALEKIGLAPEETVFIDDCEDNLDGAAKCGISPVLITAKPGVFRSGRYPEICRVGDIVKYLNERGSL